MDKEVPESATELKTLIDSWLSQHESRKLKTLAAKADVAASTLSRIYNLENAPTFETALSITYVVADERTSEEYLKKHFPKSLGLVGRFFTSKTSKRFEISDVIDDEYRFLVSNLAFARQGQPDNIKRLLGDFAVNIADKLCQDKLFEWDPDLGLIPKSHAEFGTYTNTADVLKACSFIWKWASMEHNDRSPVAVVVGLTSEEVVEVKGLIKQFLSELGAILEKSKGGEYMVAISTIYTTIFGEASK